MIVGDVVFLKADVARAVPMVVVEIDDFGGVGVQWFAKDLQVISRTFPPAVLVGDLPTAQKRCYDRFELLRAGEFLGLYEYGSIIATNFTDGVSDEEAKDTRLVFEFKKHNAKAGFFEERVRMVACGLGCTDIVCVPPHLPTANNLQLVFGETIRRINEVKARKYSHKEGLPADYAESYLIDTGKIVGSKILLVDDVITSGATIVHFARVLEGLGFEVVMFGLGLQKRLKPKIDKRFCFVV